MRYVTNKISVSLLLVLFSSGCAGQQHGFDKVTNRFAGISLGSDSLKSVQEKYGDTEIANHGDASTSTSTICYKFVLNNTEQFMVFGSNNELAGPPSYWITQIEVYLDHDNSLGSLNCKSIDSSFDYKGWIGKSKFEMTEIFENANDSGNVLSSRQCSKEYIPKRDPAFELWKSKESCFLPDENPYYDVCRTIRMMFENDSLFYFYAGITETIC